MTWCYDINCCKGFSPAKKWYLWNIYSVDFLKFHSCFTVTVYNIQVITIKLNACDATKPVLFNCEEMFKKWLNKNMTGSQLKKTRKSYWYSVQIHTDQFVLIMLPGVKCQFLKTYTTKWKKYWYGVKTTKHKDTNSSLSVDKINKYFINPSSYITVEQLIVALRKQGRIFNHYKEILQPMSDEWFFFILY